VVPTVIVVVVAAGWAADTEGFAALPASVGSG
jgi:hypothetical protein